MKRYSNVRKNDITVFIILAKKYFDTGIFTLDKKLLVCATLDNPPNATQMIMYMYFL